VDILRAEMAQMEKNRRVFESKVLNELQALRYSLTGQQGELYNMPHLFTGIQTKLVKTFH